MKCVLVASARAEATTQGNAEALATIEKVASAVKQKKLTPANVKEWAITLQTVATTGAVAAPHLYALAHWIAHFL